MGSTNSNAEICVGGYCSHYWRKFHATCVPYLTSCDTYGLAHPSPLPIPYPAAANQDPGFRRLKTCRTMVSPQTSIECSAYTTSFTRDQELNSARTNAGESAGQQEGGAAVDDSGKGLHVRKSHRIMDRKRTRDRDAAGRDQNEYPCSKRTRQSQSSTGMRAASMNVSTHHSAARYRLFVPRRRWLLRYEETRRRQDLLGTN